MTQQLEFPGLAVQAAQLPGQLTIDDALEAAPTYAAAIDAHQLAVVTYDADALPRGAVRWVCSCGAVDFARNRRAAELAQAVHAGQQAAAAGADPFAGLDADPGRSYGHTWEAGHRINRDGLRVECPACPGVAHGPADAPALRAQ